MKPFHFQKFSILQSKEVFRVGTDGLLLGALSSVNDVKNIIEVGTGTGLISLMLAQRNREAQITAMDIDENAVRLAKENFEKSPFSKNLEAIYQDYKTFNPSERFDLIVSNPPYFATNSSSKDLWARQQIQLSFENLISKSASLLNPDGLLSVIIPSDSKAEFVELGLRNNLFLQKEVVIFGIINSKPQRVVLEFGYKNIEKPVTNELIIERAPRVYTDEYLELTKDFHLFQ